MYVWKDEWIDGLSVALCLFCLVLRKLCKPVKETAKRYKHIELSKNSKTGQRVFRQKASPKQKHKKRANQKTQDK